MSRIAVLGGYGQLGQSLRATLPSLKEKLEWDFYRSSEIDVTRASDISRLFANPKQYDYILNLAAYTAVDKAETERKKAYAVNTLALKHLSKHCRESEIPLLHLSTDYVFSGDSNRPYKETDRTVPINYYGKTKLQGEEFIRQYHPQHFILRSGWIYSHFGTNFYKTIERLSKTRDEIRVVQDQIGTPTHTSIVISALLKIVTSGTTHYGTYHVGNQGAASWFEFADAILTALEYKGKRQPIPTKEYSTPAKRPKYSVLDKTKFEKTFNHQFPNWKKSFEKHLQE